MRDNMPDLDATPEAPAPTPATPTTETTKVPEDCCGYCGSTEDPVVIDGWSACPCCGGV